MIANSLLHLEPNTVYEVRKQYDLHLSGRMEAAVDLLHEWVKKQNHFTKHDIQLTMRITMENWNDSVTIGGHKISNLRYAALLYLEITIILCKGSVEKSKSMLDKLCTMRTLMPEFFGAYNVRDDFEGLRDYMVSIALRKPTEDGCRIHLFKTYDGSIKKHILNMYRYNSILAEYIRLHDYLGKSIIIIDQLDANLADVISGTDFMEFKHHSSVIVEGFGMRPQKIFILTQSKLIGALVSLIKAAVKPKIASRIEVVKSYEELEKHIPREILPRDYGGDEPSIREIQDQWLDALSSADFIEYIREMNEAKTNESLRSRSDFNENYAGMAGTFKYLNVD